MAEVKPASRMVSGQFINVQRLHVAKLLTDEAGGEATYDTPVDLGKVLRSIDIKPSNSSAELYADGQSIDTANNTASYELTFDTAALPLEYVAYQRRDGSQQGRCGSVLRGDVPERQAERQQEADEVLQSHVPGALCQRLYQGGKHFLPDTDTDRQGHLSPV